MRLYLYCSQDLILKDESNTVEIKGGDIVNINLMEDDKVCIYPKYSQGVMLLDRDVLSKRFHQQIIFHNFNNDSLLCEIKPFVEDCNKMSFHIKSTAIHLISYNETTYIKHNNIIVASIPCDMRGFEFQKHVKNEKEYGLLINNSQKWLIIFDENRLIYNDSFIDYELRSSYIQIYSHDSNIFNIGKLIKFEFDTNNIETKYVNDRGSELGALSEDFSIIYFLDAIKFGRFKYAYNALSYKLKSSISVETLNKYFNEFNKFIYIGEESAFVTLKNNKVAGIYHFVIKDNLIDDIY